MDLVARRERAAQLMTQKNLLASKLVQHRTKSDQLESEASAAVEQGNHALATQLWQKKSSVDAALAELQNQYDQAVNTIEQEKLAIKNRETWVLKKTSQARAMRTQWEVDEILGNPDVRTAQLREWASNG